MLYEILPIDFGEDLTALQARQNDQPAKPEAAATSRPMRAEVLGYAHLLWERFDRDDIPQLITYLEAIGPRTSQLMLEMAAGADPVFDKVATPDLNFEDRSDLADEIYSWMRERWPDDDLNRLSGIIKMAGSGKSQYFIDSLRSRRSPRARKVEAGLFG